MIKGGYKIVNFNGTALSGTSVDLPGIYDQIVDDYNKPIMVSGAIINGELQDDAYASVKVTDGSVELTVYDGVITVTDDDEVSFAVAKTVEELSAEIGDLTDLNTADKTGVVSAINSMVKSAMIESSSRTVHKLNIPSTSRHFLVFDSINPTLSGLVVLVACTSAGVIRVLEVAKGSDVTVTSTNNEVTVTLTSATAYNISDFVSGHADFVSVKTES